MNTAMYALSALLPLVDTTPTVLPSEDSLLWIVTWWGGIILALVVTSLIACVISMAIDDPRGECTEAIATLVGIPAVLVLFFLFVGSLAGS
ncbi:hypothetical protein QP426_07255 [Pauljensenia sp. UMB1235]|uniref:hypothetical protein n=1 Tax=unclassified Pauljensenia TaxID=2908895 RepID=UPI00255175F5|nr:MULTISPECIES: hypothetical protein [unclassified Pauljensenia]MDK6400911.1 hypothetical protein [Pauljensenia sp. UMB9872]MDK7173457.1 hypothetical protein [Pauljensenia sp. UMB1235]